MEHIQILLWGRCAAHGKAVSQPALKAAHQLCAPHKGAQHRAGFLLQCVPEVENAYPRISDEVWNSRRC